MRLPCYAGLPSIGIMALSPIVFEQDPEYAYRIILHEMGHALGLGISETYQWLGLIDCLSMEEEEDFNEDWKYFAGSSAKYFFDLMGGSLWNIPKLPLKNYGHWDENVFGDELMVSQAISSNVQMPLSVISIAALADMGYRVNFELQESYTVPIPPDSLMVRIEEEVEEEVEVIDQSAGKVTVSDNSWCKIIQFK